MKYLYLLLCVLLLCSAVLADRLVEGKLGSVTGSAPALAHVHLTGVIGGLREVLQSVEVDAEGAYSLPVKEAGVYQLWFTAVDHEAFSMPLIMQDTDQTVTINATLPVNEYHAAPPQVQIVGDWNNFNYRSPDLMEALDDGSFSFEAPVVNGEVGYQLVDLATNGHGVNGPQADAWRYDDGGDYISIIKSSAPAVKIVVKPSLMQRSLKTNRAAIKAGKNHAHLKWIFAIDQAVAAARREANRSLRAFVDAGGDETAFSYDVSALQTMLGEARANNNSAVSSFAAAQLANLSNLPGVSAKPDGKAILEILPASSPWWQFAPYAVLPVLQAAGETAAERDSLVNRFLNEQPNRVLKGNLLSLLVIDSEENGDAAAGSRWYQALKPYRDLGGYPPYVLSSFDPTRAIMAGKPVPAFAVQLLDSKESVSNQSLRGKYVLLDFWATWCGPCIREMPQLHQAYERFKGDNLVFLSLSFDGTSKPIAPFRKNDFPMPWLHTFVEGGFKSDLAQTFEVSGIPKPILIGPDGVILATGESLRGSNLATTLMKYLGSKAMGSRQ